MSKKIVTLNEKVIRGQIRELICEGCLGWMELSIRRSFRFVCYINNMSVFHYTYKILVLNGVHFVTSLHHIIKHMRGKNDKSATILVLVDNVMNSIHSIGV